MALASTFLSHANPHTNDAVFSSRNRFHSFRHFASQSNFKFKSKPISFSASATRPEPARSSISKPVSTSQTFNVLIIGAEIIGLTIARQFLIGSDMSVAVIDKAVPCSGATGAEPQPDRLERLKSACARVKKPLPPSYLCDLIKSHPNRRLLPRKYFVN